MLSMRSTTNASARGAQQQATRRAPQTPSPRDTTARREAHDAEVLCRARAARRTWSVSAQGRRLIASDLRHVEQDGWVVLHDLQWPGRQHAHIDHVAIGPGGVVVVETENWSGEVTATEGTLRQDGHRRDPSATEVSDAAADLTALLAPQHRTGVRAVLCLAAHDQAPTPVAGATVLGRRQLAAYLHSLPPRLPATDIADIAERLGRQLGTPEPTHTPEPTVTAVPRRLDDRQTARPPRHVPGSLGYALLVVAALLGTSAGPAGVVTAVSVALLLGCMWTTASGRRFAFLGSRLRGATTVVPALVVLAASWAVTAT